MEKPQWRVRSSALMIDSPFMRMRRDTIDLPDGTMISEYFVRESNGFVMIFAMTPEREVVLVRQYRYGIDEVGLEFPAGTIDPGEDPLACAKRELQEETGYRAQRWEELLLVAAEPVRSNAVMHAYLAHDAVAVSNPSLDIGEILEVETVSIDDIPALLEQQRFGSVPCVAVGYAALARLRISASV